MNNIERRKNHSRKRVQQRLNNDKTAYPIVANCVISLSKVPTHGSWSFIKGEGVGGEKVGGEVRVSSVVVEIEGNVVS